MFSAEEKVTTAREFRANISTIFYVKQNNEISVKTYELKIYILNLTAIPGR